LAALFPAEPRIESRDVALAPPVAARPAAPAPAPSAALAPPPVISQSPALKQNDAQTSSPHAPTAVRELAAPVPARALAPWMLKWQGLRGERLAVAILVAALVALLGAAIAAATTFAQPSDAVPDAQSSPQNSHN
jgi:hypothetical protein